MLFYFAKGWSLFLSPDNRIRLFFLYTSIIDLLAGNFFSDWLLFFLILGFTIWCPLFFLKLFSALSYSYFLTIDYLKSFQISISPLSLPEFFVSFFRISSLSFIFKSINNCSKSLSFSSSLLSSYPHWKDSSFLSLCPWTYFTINYLSAVSSGVTN